MQEQTIYVSDDGQRFDSAEDCQVWEQLVQKRTKIGHFGAYGLHDDDLDGRLPPVPVQEALEFEFISETLGNSLWGREGFEFVQAARYIKAVSDWLWG